MLNTSSILSRLKTLRKAKGLNQKSVAKALGIDRTTYIRKENGRIPITTEEWIELALTLNTAVGYFFENRDEDGGKGQFFTEVRDRLSTEERADIVRCMRLILEITDKEEDLKTTKD